MDNVALKKITPQTVKVFNAENYVGTATEYELNDLRIQIKDNKAEGWSVRFNDMTIPIHSNGRLADWPEGMMDMGSIQLDQLLDWDS